MNEESEFESCEDDTRALDHFLAGRGGPYENLGRTISSDRDLAAFLFKLAKEIGQSNDRGGSIEEFLDLVLSWLGSDRGGAVVRDQPNRYSAAASVLFAGTQSGEQIRQTGSTAAR